MKKLKYFLLNFQIAYERKHNLKAAWNDAKFITELMNNYLKK